MGRLRILDLLCGAGLAGEGYARAGFEVWGVDLHPMPRYPFPIIRGDALELDQRFLRAFDAIHASPPCQFGTELRHAKHAKHHDNLIPATRAMLQASGLPYVIENVRGAQKASERAKKYRGGRGGQSYRSMAYDKKAWAIDRVAKTLEQHAAALGITWGWAIDRAKEPHHHLLYVDLPTGQVSWHGGVRGPGPDYPGQWDGAVGSAPDRICSWAAKVLEGERRAA